jgi:endonuclease/exonuclease/phosphatase family metal-dependent hydrolase
VLRNELDDRVRGPADPLMVDGDWPFGRIDHLLVRRGEHGGPALPVVDCRLVFDRPWNGVQASDHYGVVADLETVSGP